MKRFIHYLIEATMTPSDALKVLGLSPHFTPDQLKDAYKKAAIANHPDKGGSVVMMQKINVARDVLSHLATTNATQHSSPYQDDDDYQDNTAPFPQRKTITYPEVFELFRKNFDADVIRITSNVSEARLPFTKLNKGENEFFLVIRRQQNNLGNEYLVKGIMQVRGSGRKMILSFSNDNDDMVFWESRDSVLWAIAQLKKVVSATSTTFNAQELKAALKLYKQTMTKIDKNIQ
jgi:hypothetical protein